MNGLYEVLDERTEGQVMTASGLWLESRRCDQEPRSKVPIKDGISPGSTEISARPDALLWPYLL